VRLTLDLEARTVSLRLDWFIQDRPAQITDSTITWDAVQKATPDRHSPTRLDRVTGVLQLSACNGNSMTDCIFTAQGTAQCRRGEKQF
jgi:hypothetical protein